MKCGPGISCFDYFPMRQCEKGKQPVHEALAGRKHGRDRSAAERRPRLPCRFGKDACDQLSFPKVTFNISYFFRVYSYGGVKRFKFLFALEAWSTTQQICELGIERQFFF